MMEMDSFRSSRAVVVLVGVLALFGLYLTSSYSYLLFHSLAEVFSIVVAFGIFVIFWNARRFVDNSYFLFVGIAYLSVGILDLFHTLAYSGMGVFTGSDTNLATQLWIAARYVQSISLLFAPLLIGRKLRANLTLAGYFVGVGLLLGAILYWDIFPVCFVEGVGLTPFKVVSEYVISLILLASLAMLYRRRNEFDASVLRLLMVSILLAIASELAFTQYAHAYAVANMMGHLLKIVSFYLIYKAVVETGLVKPYDLLFRDLKREEGALRKSEQRYRELVENVDDVIYSIDVNGMVTYISPAVESLIGYTPEEVVGHPFVEFMLQEDIQASTHFARRILSGEFVGPNQYRVVAKSGESRWIRTSSRPIVAEDQVIGLRGVLSDITERRLAEEQLLEAKEIAESARLDEEERRREADRRRQIAESLADVMAVLNSNRPLDEVLGYIAERAGQLLGNQAVGLYRLQDEDGALARLIARGLANTDAVDQDTLVGLEVLTEALASRRPVPVPDLSARLSPDGGSSPDAAIVPAAGTPGGLYQALLAVPIIVQGRIYGGIVLYYGEPRHFSDEEVELAAAFADQVALAIENDRLRDQVGEAAAIAERERLARDLHDAVTQTLFSASLIAETLPRIWERNPERAEEGLEELRKLTQGALAEMRTLLLELRPAALTDKPLGEILGHLTQAVTSRSRTPVTLHVKGDSSLPAEQQIALYRIAQEALNNVAKHAAATEVSVHLNCQPGRVALSIQDDGRGFDATEALPDQLGLIIMRERAEAIGAALEISSDPGQGTQIRVDWEETDRRRSNE